MLHKTLHSRSVVIASLLTTACVESELLHEEDALDRTHDELAAELDPEDAEAPVCKPGDTVDVVECKLALSSVSTSGSCDALVAGIDDDGTFWVTARASGSCTCEWTPPGGGQTASCFDLDDSWYAPTGTNDKCTAVQRDGGPNTVERTAWGVTYEDAEAAAIAACQAAVSPACVQTCARMKKERLHNPPAQSLTCCVPRTDDCGDGACDDDSGGESGGDASPDAPTPEAPLPAD